MESHPLQIESLLYITSHLFDCREYDIIFNLSVLSVRCRLSDYGIIITVIFHKPFAIELDWSVVHVVFIVVLKLGT